MSDDGKLMNHIPNGFAMLRDAEIESGTDWTKKDFILGKELYKGFNE